MLMKCSARSLLFVCSITLLGLGGCSGLTSSDKPAMTTWWLKPYSGVATLESTPASTSLSVSVKAVPGLDTDRVLALTTDAELKPYSAARWTENLPELTGSIISRTLTSSGHYKVLSSGDFSTSDTCKLHLVLGSFFATLDSTGKTDSVKVALEGQLQCPGKETVLIGMQETVAVQDERMKSIVAKFQQALDAVMRQMLEQLGKNT